MPTFNELVNIQVSRQTTAVPQAGFGVVLVLSLETPPTDWTTNYGDYVVLGRDDWSTGVTGLATTSEAYKFLRDHFSQDATPKKVLLTFGLTTDQKSGNFDPTVTLDRVFLASNREFYCVCPVGDSSDTNYTSDNLKKASDWANANGRICFIQSSDSTAYGSPDPSNTATEIGDILKNATTARTATWFSADDEQWITAAIAGRCLPQTPGSITFAFKQLNGIQVGNINKTQIANLDAKNYNYSREIGGTNMTLNGKMADGRFIDLTRDTDWIIARVQEAVVSRLVNSDKIPYTEDGANIIQSALDAVLEEAVRNGVIELGYTIQRPSIDDIPLNDRANRKFPEIQVTGRYAGAIHSVSFHLTLSV